MKRLTSSTCSSRHPKSLSPLFLLPFSVTVLSMLEFEAVIGLSYAYDAL